jgi:hypothetical protein
MSKTTKSVILKFDAETGDLQESLKDVEKDLDGLTEKSKDVGTEGKKGMKGLAGGTKVAAGGFSVLGTAIAATGIGLLVQLLVVLGQKLMSVKPISDLVEKGLGFMSGAFGVVIDKIVNFTEAFINLFTEPQEAIADLEGMLGPLGKILGTLFTDPLQGIKDFGSFIYNYIIEQFNKIIEGAGLLGSALMKLFSGDFSGAWEDASAGAGKLLNGVLSLTPNTAIFMLTVNELGEEIISLGKEMGNAATKGISLADAQIRLRDAQRAVNLETATAKAEIEELKMAGDDLTLSIEERIAASQKAADREEELRKKRHAVIKQEIALLSAEQKAYGVTEERMDAINELRIQEQDIIAEGAGIQTGLMTKIQALEKEQEDARRAYHQAMKDRALESADERDQEINALNNYYAEQLRLAEQYGFDTAELLQAQKDELAEIETKYREQQEQEEEESRTRIREGTIEATKAVIDAISALNEMAAMETAEMQEANAARELAIQNETDGRKRAQMIAEHRRIMIEQDKVQKKAFERDKKLRIASALINTYESATKAFNSLANIPYVGPILGGIAAAAAVAGGIAQVSMIKKQQYQSSVPSEADYAEPNLSADAGSLGQGGGGPMLDMSFLGGGDTQNVQAFVISNQVTDSQQTDQLINDQATLVA